MTEAMSCGSRLMEILAAYGVDTVFGMPGVHTLEAYRGIEAAGIRHIGVRHEQGAGFMADGYARMTGKPGVCLLISGPGVTNAATPIGQAYSDSVPMLVISSVGENRDHGMGRGRLHEITDQSRVTEPLTALSVTANSPEQLREYVARAFALFETGRKRPVHISVPLDVFKAMDEQPAKVRKSAGCATPKPEDIAAAAKLLSDAERPVIIAGGGAVGAAPAIQKLAEITGAAVVPTIAGKGILPDDHPLVLEVTLDRRATQDFIAAADVVLAIGTELSEPDTWLGGNLPMSGKFIRIDIDRTVLALDYDPDIAIAADARLAVKAMVEAAHSVGNDGFKASGAIAKVRQAERDALTPLEQMHIRVLDHIRAAIPDNGVIYSDMCQLAYTGYAFYPCNAPGQWMFPAGFGTLGYGLPAAIGGKLAAPETPVAVIAGDGGFQFTLQELGTAVENKLPLAIILWDNNSLAQIRDGMIARDIPTIGVNQHNPDFVALAKAYGCHTAEPESLEDLQNAITTAFAADGPTVIHLRENADYISL